MLKNESPVCNTDRKLMQWEPNGSNRTQVVGMGTKKHIDDHVQHKLKPGDDYNCSLPEERIAVHCTVVPMQTSWYLNFKERVGRGCL